MDKALEIVLKNPPQEDNLDGFDTKEFNVKEYEIFVTKKRNIEL